MIRERNVRDLKLFHLDIITNKSPLVGKTILNLLSVELTTLILFVHRTTAIIRKIEKLIAKRCKQLWQRNEKKSSSSKIKLAQLRCIL